MNTTTSTESAEKRVFRAFWQDGSLDLFSGMTALAIGIAWLSDMSWAGAIAPAVIIPLWASWRRRIVEPRLGQVTFRKERRLKMRRGLLLTIVLGIFSFVLGLVAYFGFDFLMEEGLLWLLPGIPALMLGLLAVLASLMLGLRRFLFYAFGFLLGGLAVAALDTRPGWGMAAGGAVTMLGGMILLVRFFNEYPVMDREMK